MTRDDTLQRRPCPLPVSVGNASIVPVLIRVPSLPAERGPSVRNPARTRRRRLRREVRMAGYGLLVAVPVVLIALALGGGRRSLAVDRPAHEAEPAPRPPVISLWIDRNAPGSSGDSEAEPPVVLPGYLLPDDGPEEPAHAGS